jgi:hypothetical protein
MEAKLVLMSAVGSRAEYCRRDATSQRGDAVVRANLPCRLPYGSPSPRMINSVSCLPVIVASTLTFTGWSSLRENVVVPPGDNDGVLRRLRLSAPITSSNSGHGSFLLGNRPIAFGRKWHYTLETKVAAATLFLEIVVFLRGRKGYS